MTKRPITNTRRKWLSEELDAWQGTGLISAEQRQAIVEQYPTIDDAAEATSSKAVTALMGMAALLVAAGVLLLISFNWEAMPAAVKLVLIFGTIVTTYVGAFSVRYQRGAIGLSNVLFCLGAIFYGCGIWLVAQVFHLNGHYDIIRTRCGGGHLAFCRWRSVWIRCWFTRCWRCCWRSGAAWS